MQFVESKRSQDNVEDNSLPTPENDPLNDLSNRLDGFEDLGNVDNDDLPF